MELNDRQTATVLAALRYWQDEMLGRERAYFPMHFRGRRPLTRGEIDRLAERINVGEGFLPRIEEGRP